MHLVRGRARVRVRVRVRVRLRGGQRMHRRPHAVTLDAVSMVLLIRVWGRVRLELGLGLELGWWLGLGSANQGVDALRAERRNVHAELRHRVDLHV